MTAVTVVVTGANGLVGAALCRRLVQDGADVRAVVRRGGQAPAGTVEHVGDFDDGDFAARVLAGAQAAVTTVHPMGSPEAVQRAVGVTGTTAFAAAASRAGVARLLHVSTAAVYDRSPGAADVDEASPLVADDADPYARTKRDADRALAGVEGLTRVLLRPPAVLGPGATSVWNTLRPAQVRRDPAARSALPQATFAWVHVSDLVALAADVATGRVGEADDPATGPVAGGCTAVNVAGQPASVREYHATVCRAVGVQAQWADGAAWTGQLLTARARGWGWAPRVGLQEALAELESGLP